MRRVFILMVLFIPGCAEHIETQYEYWEPTVIEISKGEQIAKDYALKELDLSDTALLKMKTKIFAWKENEVKNIKIDFYDVEFYPDWNKMSGLRGGFPHYFSVYIDANNWIVTDHYACTE